MSLSSLLAAGRPAGIGTVVVAIAWSVRHVYREKSDQKIVNRLARVIADAPPGCEFVFKTARNELSFNAPSAPDSGLPSAHECGDVCNEFEAFFRKTCVAIITTSRCIWPANSVAARNRVSGRVDSFYQSMHIDWAAVHSKQDEAGRETSLWMLVFNDAVSHRPLQDKIARSLDKYFGSLQAKGGQLLATKADLTDCKVIADVIRRLPEAECMVFMCVLFTELTDAEIAVLLGLDVSAVRTHRRHALSIFNQRCRGRLR